MAGKLPFWLYHLLKDAKDPYDEVKAFRDAYEKNKGIFYRAEHPDTGAGAGVGILGSGKYFSPNPKEAKVFLNPPDLHGNRNRTLGKRILAEYELAPDLDLASSEGHVLSLAKALQSGGRRGEITTPIPEILYDHRTRLDPWYQQIHKAKLIPREPEGRYGELAWGDVMPPRNIRSLDETPYTHEHLAEVWSKQLADILSEFPVNKEATKGFQGATSIDPIWGTVIFDPKNYKRVGGLGALGVGGLLSDELRNLDLGSFQSEGGMI